MHGKAELDQKTNMHNTEIMMEAQRNEQEKVGETSESNETATVVQAIQESKNDEEGRIVGLHTVDNVDGN